MSIDGFDPLEISLNDSGERTRLLEEQTKRFIESILKSYTGFYDVFSELAQNCIDALEKKVARGDNFKPKIWIKIDIPNSTIKFVDNGVGMTEEEFKYFLAPSVSFKTQSEGRGHKGVGATFLAYGYSFVRVQSRNSNEIAAVLRQGRQWAEDRRGTIPRPKFEGVQFEVSELNGESSGTSVEILVGKTSFERPRDLSWMGAQTADQWYDLLRIKTPIGGVYLDSESLKFSIDIEVISSEGVKSHKEFAAAEYYYPHEIPDFKVASISEINKALSSVQGDAQTKFSKAENKFKRLDVIYEVWDQKAILADESPFVTALDSSHRQLIERHRITCYASFLRSAKLWTMFNDEILKLRKGQRVIHGGMQLATDSMVQGDLSVIPLTSSIGYQANSHVIVHFRDGNPDMGRKTFQPELTELAELLSVRAVNTMRKYLQHLKPDTGAPTATPKKALHDWIKFQEGYRDTDPLTFIWNTKQLALLSVPQQEQDVIALFHELVGADAIKGIRFFATSSHETYDSLIQCEYEDRAAYAFSKNGNRMGVSEDLVPGHVSEPKVLEYKYDLDGLMEDFSKEVKVEDHIDLVVCWKAGKKYKERYFLNSLLVGDEGSVREIFGSTHQAFRDGSDRPSFEIIILEDLLSYLRDPEEEEAKQKITYSD